MADKPRICKHCVLPETFPGIRLNDQGICQHCVRCALPEKRDAQKRKYFQRFRALIDTVRSRGPYDAVMAYSGGKDSSFTLKILRDELGLNVLAITFNNGFLSSYASGNIRAVTDSLDVPHLMISPSPRRLCHAFRESVAANPYSLAQMQRASAICTTCMNLAKSLVLRSAIEMGVSVMAYGWSPGQVPIQASVMRLNVSLIRQTQSAMIRSLQRVMGGDLSRFVLQERHYRVLASDGSAWGTDGALYNVHPLAFWGAYDEDDAVKSITALGWRYPNDTDANSTNCLLNSFANKVHHEEFGFHPYAFEISGLIRAGYMTRETGLAKLSAVPDKRVLQNVRKKLGL